MKHIEFIHNGGYIDFERELDKQIIFSNTIQFMRSISRVTNHCPGNSCTSSLVLSLRLCPPQPGCHPSERTGSTRSSECPRLHTRFIHSHRPGYSPRFQLREDVKDNGNRVQCERRKFIHCFDNVTGILFLASMNEPVLSQEDGSVNGSHEALTDSLQLGI